MNAPDVAFQVARQFSALRRRYFLVHLASTTVMTFVIAVGLWLVLAAADYTWELPRGVRQAAIFVVSVGTLAWFSWQTYLILQRTNPRFFAGLLERTYQEFGQRIRTVLDTVNGRVNGPAEMLGALGNQTLGRWESASPHGLVPVRFLYFVGSMATVLLFSLLTLFMVSDEGSIALTRALGMERPYTMLQASPGDTKILEGSPVKVSLRMTGRTDRDVLLRYRELAEGKWGDASIERESDWVEIHLLPEKVEQDAPSVAGSFFQSLLGKATKPIEYQFLVDHEKTTDYQTPVHRIEIQRLVKTERIDIDVVPPEYTGIQARLFSSAELTVLEQSKVTVSLVLTQPLAKATLLQGPKASKFQAVTLEPGDDPTHWKFELPSDKSFKWSFKGETADGTPLDPVNGRLTVRHDGPPQLRWREPSDGLRVHTLAEVPLAVQAADDHGIIDTGIVFRLGGDDEYVLTQWDLEMANQAKENEAADTSSMSTTQHLLKEILPLESFGLTERDFVAYYAYAVDNCPWEPHRSESDVRYIDIRPLRQFYREIELPPGNGGAGGPVIVQLAEIIRRERFLSNRTRSLIRDAKDMSAQLGTIDRLVENQSELADLTRFLAEFFVALGNDDVEALSQAEAAMLQASDSLAAGALDLALAQEQEALRSLAEARQTLEVALTKRMTSAQRQALRRLARQMRQKLRRDRPETTRELADSVKRVASEQRQLAGALAQLGKASRETAAESEEPQVPKEEAQGTEEERFEQQVELMDRLDAIANQMSNQIEESELLYSRMTMAQSMMDQIATAIREGEFGSAHRLGIAASDLLLETSMQLETLGAREPVTRVSLLRDLTSGMAALEGKLSDVIRKSVGDTQQDNQSDEQRDEESEKRQRLAKQLAARSETLTESLSAQASIGDIEMSEVNESLREFVSETDFARKLARSLEAAEPMEQPEAMVSEEDSDQAMERSAEYIAAARQLDYLYQQLVAPRLARLRRMERKASQLASQLNGPGNKSSEGKGSKGKGERQKEALMGVRLLEKELEKENMRELADWLREGIEDTDADQPPNAMTKGENGISLSDGIGERVNRVAQELRRRIQQVVLLEIAVDQNAAVPSKYRRAVDGYFRTLTSDEPAQMQDVNIPAEGAEAF